jgi:prophage regulatory protein
VRKIIGKKEVKEATGLSDTTIWRLERVGRFPRRVNTSENRCGWFEDEVEVWQNSLTRGIEGRVIQQATCGTK